MTAEQSVILHTQREGIEIPQENTLPYAELASVCTELQRIYDEAETLEKEMFIITAENEGLDEAAFLFDTESIKTRILALLSICEKNGCTLLKEHLGDPFGISGTLTEENGTVYFDTPDSLSQEMQQQIQSKMKKLMPVNTVFSLRTV